MGNRLKQELKNKLQKYNMWNKFSDGRYSQKVH